MFGKRQNIGPELVAPAGDWASLRTAVDQGADSVYFGIKALNMRHGASNFEAQEITKVMAFLHDQGKKGYVALNTIIYDHEIKKVERILKAAKQAGVDAVIGWDAAVVAIARALRLRVHLSTQASVANTRALKFYAGLGVKRVVLARECTLEDIRHIMHEIKVNKIPCEIEAFIHGAMCVSISGRCFLSGFAFAQSANRGKCLQPCRREYIIQDKEEGGQFILGEDYILSPEDLCTIDFMDQLVDSNVHAFKIEGRMRKAEYVGVVTSVYRQAIDAHRAGRLTPKVKREFKERLSKVYNRGFCDGFYFGEPQGSISRRQRHLFEKVFIGEVIKFYKKVGVAEVLLRQGPLTKDDTLLFIGKSLPLRTVRAHEMQQDHQFITEAQKGQKVGIKVPCEVKPHDKVFIWKAKGSR